MAKKTKITFREFLEKIGKQKKYKDHPYGDFVGDVKRAETHRFGTRDPRPFPNFTAWADLEEHLEGKRACKEAIETAKALFLEWQWKHTDIRHDGLGPKESVSLSRAIRQVWHRSHSRGLVIKRCTGADGFLHCEKCKQKVPKIQIDHIEQAGNLKSEGFIERMFCPSSGLQGLCIKCHAVKTKEEAKNRGNFY
jgi:hypothetical protein